MRVKVLKDYIDAIGNLHKTDTEEEWAIPGAVQRALLENGFAEVIDEGHKRCPEIDEQYLYLDDELEIRRDCWDGDSIDNKRLFAGNVFRMAGEAEKATAWLKALKVLLEDSEHYKPKRNSGFFFFVYYDIYTGKFGVDYWCANCGGAQCPSPIAFRSEEDAQASIAKHTKEWKTFLGVDE